MLGELKSNLNNNIALKAQFDLGKYIKEVFAAQNTYYFVLGFTLYRSIIQLQEYNQVGGITSLLFNINKDRL